MNAMKKQKLLEFIRTKSIIKIMEHKIYAEQDGSKDKKDCGRGHG